ncbi:hypothetical protein QQ045_016385 [Rhodiola kirilowii]
MYKTSVWNIRGLNNPYKKSEVLSWIKKNKVDVVALLEVKLQENKWDDTVKRCSPDDQWNVEFSAVDGGWARILLLWNGANIKIRNLVKSYFFMACEVEADNKQFSLIVVYASNNQGDRKLMWEEIEKEEKKIRRSFRYCNFWENFEDYEEAVRVTWNNGNKCRNLFMIQTKLKEVKSMMKQRFVGRTRGMENRVNSARTALMEAQSNSESNPNDIGFCEAERRLALEFRKLKYNQFVFNKQRTNAQWIKEGDANTKFFHSLLKSRRARNNVAQITLSDGSLVRGATDKEIWSALNCIGNDKSSSPDGFSSSLFKRNWKLMGKEICEGVRHCLRHNALPKGVNAAYIALIPKSRHACKPEDYRPISYCNVTYTIVSSLLAGRLKEVLPDIINPAQGAFVKDRSIVNNICLAQ